jgi:hypothetical protein
MSPAVASTKMVLAPKRAIKAATRKAPPSV